MLGRVAYDGNSLVGYGIGSASNCGKSRSAAAPNATQSNRPPITVPLRELGSLSPAAHLLRKPSYSAKVAHDVLSHVPQVANVPLGELSHFAKSTDAHKPKVRTQSRYSSNLYAAMAKKWHSV